MLKLFARTAVLAAFGVGVLLLMHHYGLLDFASVARAFRVGRMWVLLVLGTQIALGFTLMYRYSLLVRRLGVDVPFSALTSATFVSNAVGQWAPGALAVTEMLRMSLMLGVEKAQGRALSQNAARLAVASLFDRCVGFFTMMFVGGTATVVVLVGAVGSGRMQADAGDAGFVGLLLLAAFSFLGAAVIVALPFLARWRVTHALLSKARAALGHGFLGRNLGRVQSLVHVLGEGVGLFGFFIVPVVLSIFCMILSCLGLLFSSFAIGEGISFWAILATFSITSIATLFPLGFGGLGGYQLVAVAVFGLFGVRPAVVSSASVLQCALLLMVNTLLGALYAHHSSKQITAILTRTKAVKA